MPSRPSDAEFAAFARTAWPPLYRTAYLLVGDHGLAEDLVQTSLAKTYASWNRVRDVSAAGVYARTVLINTATSWFRRRGWRNEIATEHLPDAGQSHDETTGPSLMAALRALPPRQRAVVVLRYYDDLDVGQTAAVLGISPGTVKSQTAHALAKLRVSLGEAFALEGATHD